MKSNDRQLCWHRRQVQRARDCHAGSHVAEVLGPLTPHLSSLPLARAPPDCPLAYRVHRPRPNTARTPPSALSRTGAAVHFRWPGGGFQLLGMLSNDKPSAIVPAGHILRAPVAPRGVRGRPRSPGPVRGRDRGARACDRAARAGHAAGHCTAVCGCAGGRTRW
ncbi:hypothetical protein B0H21DRAFT_721904 [Amylocystis lapponica]|nr:hypothetical protein B0H21DRAFT_721904 [Amylocystis lapponica]